MVDKDRLKRQKATLQVQIDAMLPVVDAALDLVRSGYDGPFMGPEVEPLVSAVATYENTLGTHVTREHRAPPWSCRAPKDCEYHLACETAGRCIIKDKG